jgi:hypothetical protein
MFFFWRSRHHRRRAAGSLLPVALIIAAELAWAPFLLTWTFRVLIVAAVASVIGAKVRGRKGGYR